jgi:hypothetical protein
MNQIENPATPIPANPITEADLPIIVRLSGVSFGDAQANIKKFAHPDIRWFPLVRDRDNPHDPNAIKVALFGRFEMGYIPKEIASRLAPLMDAGKDLDAEFVCVNRHPSYDLVGLTVKIIETVSLIGKPEQIQH